MIVAGNEIIGPIRRQNFRSFRFFTADTQAGLGWNVMKNDLRFPGLSANRGTSIEPDSKLQIPSCRQIGGKGN